jgi:hypothetical protein
MFLGHHHHVLLFETRPNLSIGFFHDENSTLRGPGMKARVRVRVRGIYRDLTDSEVLVPIKDKAKAVAPH